jgi:DNA adenine methylase
MSKRVKPFLKWAGGKTQLLGDIEQQFPYATDEEFAFVEPFVGSGAVLFWVLNHFPNVQQCVINDINADLINTYHTIRNNVDALIEQLDIWQTEYHALALDQEHKKVYYYAKRAEFNTKQQPDIQQAALFIFLNRTCFNGLYRVNRSGGFNVPIGSYKTPKICDAENLKLVSAALQRVTILCGDFEQTLEHAQGKTMFYLDPPYKPLSASSSFNAYAKGEFNDAEQIRLKNFCDTLSEQKLPWILSNSDVNQLEENNFFDELYDNYHINRVLAKRAINSNSAKRGSIHELLITNQVAAA